MAISRNAVLYLAGPMTGVPDSNYPAFFEAAERLRCAGFTVLNPADAERLNPTPGIPQSWEWYMRHGLRTLLEADGIALLPGWTESRGTKLEVTVGEALGMRMWAVEMWLADAVHTETERMS